VEARRRRIEERFARAERWQAELRYAEFMESAAPLPGTQDLLFEGARRLRRCEAALCAVFEKAGYAEVVPPAIEAADVFGPEAFRALDRSGKLVALRSDFTAQVARIAATRLAGVSPLKLYYRGSIVRRADFPGEHRIFLRAGGSGGRLGAAGGGAARRRRSQGLADLARSVRARSTAGKSARRLAHAGPTAPAAGAGGGDAGAGGATGAQ